ncbi:hypothetical protein HDV00_007006 [Rhizophlyctis rosea]|nr:hypothetical protein HDV00_007006 [Rhizophlyctis rosea]
MPSIHSSDSSTYPPPITKPPAPPRTDSKPDKSSAPAPSRSLPQLNLALNLLFAAASCITVANVYWNQAILSQMGKSFNVSEGDIGTVATVTTAGYAVGLLFVTPLGDMVSRRIVILILCLLITLLSIALSFIPWLPLFKVVSFLIGVTTVVPQIMVPLVADLAPDARRGKAVGMVMSGLMLGILGARVISGLIARYASWRVVYYVASGLNALVTVLLYFFLPALPRHTQITYPKLMKSLWTLLKEEIVLQQASAIVFFVFAGFQLFWTDLTFHLSGRPFGYDSFEVGLFGLIGIAGILCAPIAGHIGDVHGPYLVAALGLTLYAVSLAIMLIWSNQVAAMVVGAFVLDMSMQMCQLSNQIRIYALLPTARSRLTSVYMVLAFLGGSMGSATGSNLFQHHGWHAALYLALAWIGVAALIHLARTPRQVGFVPGWLRGGRWWTGVERSKKFVEEEGVGKQQTEDVGTTELEEVTVDGSRGKPDAVAN